MQKEAPYYVIDAFADELFRGNPAGVCLLDEWLPDLIMQRVAAENNLAETAFLVKSIDGYDLRWFTPKAEIDLCGHATLASAFVITRYVDASVRSVRFHTKSGLLTVDCEGDLLEMNFPSRPPEPIPVTAEMSDAIGVPVIEAHLSRDLVLLVASEKQIRELSPDINAIAQLPEGLAVAVTAKGETSDFVSRFFAPKLGVPEDPVTGSSHTTLISFWSERLGRETLVAEQLSPRGGTLYCKQIGDRLQIAGRAVPYLRGTVSFGQR
jgi:PhzF family phenazine biosynthesis protein